jgi:L-lactate dehydrogenase complex protein LldG
VSAARERILDRVREALKGRAAADHPGPFESWLPDGRPVVAPVARFGAMLEAAGGEVVRLPGEDATRQWLARFSSDFASVAVGETVPRDLRPSLPAAAPDVAPLGVSLARGAIAETGSLLLDARDGRRAQLLPPTHVVLVYAADVHATFRDAVASMRDDLPSAIGLHSGPSKSADIGHIMVKGVHGPGRLIAAIIDTGARAGRR